MPDAFFLYAGAGLAIASAVWAVLRLVREEGAKGRVASGSSAEATRRGRGPEVVLVPALAAVIGFLVARGVRTGSFPACDLGESLAVFSLAIGACYLALARDDASRSLGAFVLPMGAALATASAVVVTLSGPHEREFDSLFLAIHATSSFAAYAAFAFGCGASVAYLLQEHALRSKKLGVLFRRLPSLSALDALSLRSVEVGFPLLTVGIATGSVWASRAWGTYWTWEPKLTLALLLWLLAAAVFHMRTIEKRQGRRTALLTIASGVMVLAVFLGAMLFPGGRHAFL